MDRHKFKIGDNVRLVVRPINDAKIDSFTVSRLLPAQTDDRHDHQYRIQSRSTGIERVVRESELSSSGA
jgi:hypothetical protein